MRLINRSLELSTGLATDNVLRCRQVARMDVED